MDPSREGRNFLPEDALLLLTPKAKTYLMIKLLCVQAGFFIPFMVAGVVGNTNSFEAEKLEFLPIAQQHGHKEDEIGEILGHLQT